MPAFKPEHMQFVHGRLQEYRERVMDQLHDYDMTAEQFIEMAFPPKLREFASDPGAFIAIPFVEGDWEVDLHTEGRDIRVGVSVNHGGYNQPGAAPAIPKSNRPHNPEPLIAFVRDVAPVAEKLNTARNAINQLDRICSSPQQVRFFMPSITTLLEGYEGKYAKALEPMFKGAQPPTLPALSPELRADIHTASSIITAASLLPMERKQRLIRFDLME
jgi:hypothetical protein